MAREQVHAAVPPAIARVGGAVSPIGLVLTGEDHLRVFAANVVTGARVSIELRTLVPGGLNVIANQYSFAASLSPFGSFEQFPLPDGVLLNVVCRTTDVTVERGQCFARVDLVRGRAARHIVATLISGYIGSWGGLAWPGSPLESSLDGPGWVHVLEATTPAPGASVTITMPFAARWRVLSCQVNLSTDATAGNRTVFFQALQSALSVGFSLSSLEPGPSTGTAHAFGAGMAPVSVATTTIGIGPLPVPLLLSTATVADAEIRCGRQNGGAADQLDAFRALVEEWRNPTSSLGE